MNKVKSVHETWDCWHPIHIHWIKWRKVKTIGHFIQLQQKNSAHRYLYTFCPFFYIFTEPLSLGFSTQVYWNSTSVRQYAFLNTFFHQLPPNKYMPACFWKCSVNYKMYTNCNITIMNIFLTIILLLLTTVSLILKL